MDISFLKNPIIIAVIVSTLVYLYMYWENEKRYKKNPKATKESVSLITPAVIGLISWFIASSYFGSDVPQLGADDTNLMLNNGQNLQQQPLIIQHGDQTVNKFKLIGNENNANGGFTAGSSESRSYHLIGKNNIKLPQTDVFIDVARF